MELFGTSGIRGDVGEKVTPDLALQVGRAAGVDGDTFVLGYDGRVTAPVLADAFAAGLASAGATVQKIGQVPTPALAYATQGRRGVMITASHNPPSDNGFKLFEDGQEYGTEAEDRIEQRVAAGEGQAVWDEWGGFQTDDVLPTYRNAVVEYAQQYGTDPEGISVAVGCGNGMASVVTPHVLNTVGVSVRTAEANVDGHFPARESKPTPESLSAFRSFVATTDTDFGFGHDGDGDRIVLVDSDGSIVHEDTVLAMLAEHYTATATVEDPVVVTTPNASGRIDERVEAAGGRVERTRLGALHEGIASVRASADEETAVVFAAEPWKHVHPAFGGWIDVVVSAAMLTRLFADRDIDERRDPIKERPYRKVAVECPDDAKSSVMSSLEDTLPREFPDASASTDYGVRLSFADGSWTLVRQSGTEPVVRIYAESDDVDALIDDVTELVESVVDEHGR